MYNFIKILVTGEVEQWVGGYENWVNIYNEYCDIMPSKNSTYVFQLKREIAYIESKLIVVQKIIDAFQIMYMPELVPTLSEYGFFYSFTPETMFEDLKGVNAECQSWVVQKEVKKGELDRFIEAQSKGDPMTENEWDELITELEKYQGYQMDTKILTVSKFVGIFNRYKRENGKQSTDR